MRGVRNVVLIGLGMLLGASLLLGAGAVLAQGPAGAPGWMMRGSGGMMGGAGGVSSYAGMAQMHAQMNGGQAMPAACTAMMDDPAMMGHMMQMMHGGAPMTLAECQQWMTAQGIPADVQAQCLAHMAQYHRQPGATPTPAAR